MPFFRRRQGWRLSDITGQENKCVGGAAEGRTYKAGGYVRLSVKDTKPGEDTLRTQRELVEGYIAAQPDMVLQEIYMDNGRTGTNFSRPAFDRLMTDARSQVIDCIVVKDLSRFGRNYLEAGEYIERVFPMLGVRFVAINERFDTCADGNPADALMVSLRNIMNAAYSRDISRKTVSALALKQREGKYIGSFAPYGYRKSPSDRHRLEPDGETAPVVRMIFKMRVSGAGLNEIAGKLNALGIPSPSRTLYIRGELTAERFKNTDWRASTVRNILTHQVYLGHMVQRVRQGGVYVADGTGTVPEGERAVVENTHEPIIEEEIFKTVLSMGERRGDRWVRK